MGHAPAAAGGAGGATAPLARCTEATRGAIVKRTAPKPPHKGLAWDSNTNTWRVRISAYGKQRHLGRYADEREAATVYDCAALLLFGKNTTTNLGADAALLRLPGLLKDNPRIRAARAVGRERGLGPEMNRTIAAAQAAAAAAAAASDGAGGGAACGGPPAPADDSAAPSPPPPPPPPPASPSLESEGSRDSCLPTTSWGPCAAALFPPPGGGGGCACCAASAPAAAPFSPANDGVEFAIQQLLTEWHAEDFFFPGTLF